MDSGEEHQPSRPRRRRIVLAAVLVVGLGVALLWQPVQWDRAINALHVDDLGRQVSTTRNLLPDLPSGCRV